MNRRQSLTAGALVAGLLMSGAAFAQGPRGGGPGGPGRAGGPGGGPGGAALALGALDLTDAQKQQIREITEQERADTRQLQERLRAAADAQRAAIQTVPMNEGLIRTAAQALADVQADVAVQRSVIYNQVWAVLTPAQQAKATTVRAQREARQDDRRGEIEQRRRNRRTQ